MKVPKIFIPENKSLDEKVARLCESSVEARLCIRDMLLQKYSFDLVTYCELTDFAFKINYPFLDTYTKIFEGLP